MGVVNDTWIVPETPKPIPLHKLEALVQDLVNEPIVAAPYKVLAGKAARQPPDLIWDTADEATYTGHDLDQALQAARQGHDSDLAIAFGGLHPDGPDICAEAEGLESACELCTFKNPEQIHLTNDAYLDEEDLEEMGIDPKSLETELGPTHIYFRVTGKHAPGEWNLEGTRLMAILTHHLGQLVVATETS